MAWRAMGSLLVLRDQVNLLAPLRSRGADGTVCNDSHPRTSDHCPHDVPGVGTQMVTALDLTHDPAGGFDSYAFAETLRINRDPRIKYVISNRRMFSSYATGSYPAWTWRPYSGSTDPHTGHVHISVLDALISDTRTLWDLDGFGEDMTPGQQYVLHVMNYRLDGLLKNRDVVVIPAFTAADGSKFPAITENNVLRDKLEEILAAAKSSDPATAVNMLLSGTFTGTATPEQ